MRVIVFGASGGIGRKVVPLLLAAGHSVAAFVRASSNRKALDVTDAAIVVGDALDRSSVDSAFAGQKLLSGQFFAFTTSLWIDDECKGTSLRGAHSDVAIC